MDLSKFKAEFQNRNGIQFNNAGMGPISNRAATRAMTMINEFNQFGALHEKNTLTELKKARENLAEFLDADPGEVAYLSNCAAGLSQIAFGQKLTAVDTIVTVDQEYSSNFYPWKVACDRVGARLIVVASDAKKQVPMDALLAAIKPGVKCVAVSWVQFQTGAIIDLKTLGKHCHAMGAKLVVDGIQGIGQLPISFRELPIDALVGGAHKWLCSISGQGFLVVKKDWLREMKPIMVGAGTFNRFGTFGDANLPMETSARKFESGGLNFTTIFALDEAIRLQQEVGVSTIAAEITRLSKRLREGLIEFASRGLVLVTPFDQLGGITSFQMPTRAEARFLELCQKEDCTVIKRGEFLRASIHAFNTDVEVDDVLDLIREALG